MHRADAQEALPATPGAECRRGAEPGQGTEECAGALRHFRRGAAVTTCGGAGCRPSDQRAGFRACPARGHLLRGRDGAVPAVAGPAVLLLPPLPGAPGVAGAGLPLLGCGDGWVAGDWACALGPEAGRRCLGLAEGVGGFSERRSGPLLGRAGLVPLQGELVGPGRQVWEPGWGRRLPRVCRAGPPKWCFL